MILFREVFLLIPQLLLVHMLKHEKPVTELVWNGRCTQHSRALNDCNWCRCDHKHRYTCDARVCGEVDMFGHFNDAIQDIDVGMEGHGFWRSTELACEPGVQYQREGLLCVCTEDGTWPSPVCRDIFRILHSVEMTGQSEVSGQKCSPTKLYLIGCNVCFCPSTARLDPAMCTRKKCIEEDPVVQEDSEKEKSKQSDDELVEIYAECRTDHKYQLGCKTCNCLRNNRLHCGNCTNVGKEKRSANSFCNNVKTGQIFNRDCNLCYCDKKGFVYCSSKKCLSEKDVSFPKSLFNKTNVKTDQFFDGESEIPGRTYKRDCNKCWCNIENDNKLFFGTLTDCGKPLNPASSIQKDCVKGTVYELNCLICHCNEIDGVKAQVCYVNPKCNGRDANRSNDLDSLHGYCEPFHVYKKGCNTCHCLSDGKTVRCTSYECEDKSSADPLSVDIVPITQNGSRCPKGLSYKIDCNYCFCLSNGNAICTTADCRINKGT